MQRQKLFVVIYLFSLLLVHPVCSTALVEIDIYPPQGTANTIITLSGVPLHSTEVMFCRSVINCINIHTFYEYFALKGWWETSFSFAERFTCNQGHRCPVQNFATVCWISRCRDFLQWKRLFTEWTGLPTRYLYGFFPAFQILKTESWNCAAEVFVTKTFPVHVSPMGGTPVMVGLNFSSKFRLIPVCLWFYVCFKRYVVLVFEMATSVSVAGPLSQLLLLHRL